MKNRIKYLLILFTVYMLLLAIKTNAQNINPKKERLFNLGAYHWVHSGKTKSHVDHIKRQKQINKTNKYNERVIAKNIKKSQNRKYKFRYND